MRIDFRGIRMRLQSRLELSRLRATLALLNLTRTASVKLGSQAQKEKFAAEWETQDQEAGEKWKLLHRRALYASVGQALCHWAEMEELLVAIASLLLRTQEFSKVGTIMYSIVSFPVWLSIIDDLFLLEPRYITLKPRWDKLNSRLMGLKTTRDRLAHHTIHYGDNAVTLAGDTSLRPGRFDIRQKVQKYKPLDFDEIAKFSDSLCNVHEHVATLLNAMTDILTCETSQGKSSEPGPGKNFP
jgi:hypothetical protein